MAKKENNLKKRKAFFVLGLSLFLLASYPTLSQIKKTKAFLPDLDISYPKNIEIDNKLSVPVAFGGIVDDKWILSDKYSLYLPTSGSLGEGFNTIIYGHNTKNIFGGLENLEIGDNIQVKDNYNKVFSYQVFEIEEIKNNDLEEIRSSVPNTLTLLTCAGTFDQLRLVVKAKLD